MQNKDIELLVFSAPWCSGCKVLKKSLEENSIPYKEINVDEAQNEEFISEYKIRALPTTIGLKEGEIVLSMVGTGAIQDVLELVK